jgi:PAS domain S-box-containing protein
VTNSPLPYMTKISAMLPLNLVSQFWFLIVQADRIVTVSDGLARGLIGQGDERLKAGACWWEGLDLDDFGTARTWRVAVAAGGKPGAHFARARSGARWWRLQSQRATDGVESNDAPWILAVEDVTAEREESERARLEAEHFHALIQRSSEGISLFDKTSKILYESPSNKRIHGYDPEEMEGLTLMSFCHPDDAARIGLRFKHLAEAPGVVETEIVRFRHKQGHYIYLEGTVLNATDDPRLGAMVNNFRDVTGRLETERELRRAKSAAEEAQRLQQHFLTNLSHEFKTPLTLIRGPLETMTAELEATERGRKALPLMFRNIDRLDALLTELIDLARLEAGAFALKTNRRDLCLFVRRQVEHFGEVAKGKRIRLKLEAPDECWAFFDATKLDKVMVNLIGNALKFSPADTEIRVSVYVRADADGQGQVEVAVSDEGAGMNEATRARVFERFYQGDAGLARGHEGMGIGLAIAREMVEMHGGALTVESEPGLGSTFTFTLPLGCEHLDPDDIDTAEVPEARPHTIGVVAGLPDETADGELPPGTGMRPSLLLVEDNLDMRAYLRLHLDLHYDVREAVDGRQALAELEHALPAIIVSDVMMPNLNGLELCQRIRADERWKRIPIILLSAKAAVDHRIEGLKAGADDYMAKPFSVSELLERLRARLPLVLVTPASADQIWLEKLEACVAAGFAHSRFDVEQLAGQIGYSSRQVRRRVLAYCGMTPAALLLKRRLEAAHAMIGARSFSTVAEVAHAVGLSPTYFSRRYRQAYRCDEIKLT